MNNIRKYIFPFAVACMLLLLMGGCKKNGTYTIIFDANGGTGTMEPQIFIEDVPQALRLNEFTCDNCTFSYWSPLKQHVFSTPESPKNEYRNGETITVSANMILYAHWENITRGQSNGHEWVDLGLPSGTKWATCNVGAETIEGYGNYYAWGETEPKETYNWSTYRYCNGEDNKLNKYCYDSSYGNDGFTDTLAILEANDDAATVNWGTGWRMPTYDELKELKNHCTITWSTVEGVDGYTFVGPNGNSIFLPAAGSYNDNSIIGGGSYGYYWSSSLDVMEGPWAAWELGFYSTNYLIGDGSRCIGFSVRPVLIENK